MPHASTLDRLARGLGLSPALVRQAAHDSLAPAVEESERLAVLCDLAHQMSDRDVRVLIATARQLVSDT
jgi:hypothetical protein